jgi:hypothetical protein
MSFFSSVDKLDRSLNKKMLCYFTKVSAKQENLRLDANLYLNPFKLFFGVGGIKIFPGQLKSKYTSR